MTYGTQVELDASSRDLVRLALIARGPRLILLTVSSRFLQEIVKTETIVNNFSTIRPDHLLAEVKKLVTLFSNLRFVRKFGRN